MISSKLRSGEALPPPTSQKVDSRRPTRRLLHSLALLCLLLACVGTSWFAYQIFLVPQARDFTPDWQDARWVQASDTTAPVAYFRYTAQFDVLPDNAFITVAANQVFRLYVNGIYIGGNTLDFVNGNAPQTYMFDIDSTLVTGPNAIGIRVANVDQGVPQVRATFGALWGKQVRYYSTGNGWVATGDTTLAHPRAETSVYMWAKPVFDASQWRTAQPVAQPPASGPLRMNPQIYEQPMASHWISAGIGQESYFVRQISLPSGFDNALLRLVATGEADIFINDHLYMSWHGQVNVPETNVVNFLSDNGEPAPYRNGLLMGVYDITPYVHAGNNTIAVHVLAPGSTTAKVGLDTLKSAMALDILVGSQGTYSNALTNDAEWHTASQPVAGWTHASSATTAWGPPEPVGRPGSSRTFYLPDSNTPRNIQVTPPVLIDEVVAGCVAGILALWLLWSLLVMRRYYTHRRTALEVSTLIFLPALAVEAVLVALSREPQLPQPFPYTWVWGIVLIGVVGIGALVLWLSVRRAPHLRQQTPEEREHRYRFLEADSLPRFLFHNRSQYMTSPLRQRILTWLRFHWGILPIFLLAIPMVCYNIAYEPYWQDELSSYYAAVHIIYHGFPAFPSDFPYPKGELFSYLLALVMSIFGTTSLIVPRMISVVCFLASLPILYVTGCALFNRKVAWLATAMLALSPYTMIWSRQTRMYELAQFMVIIVLFTFYRALQQRDRILPLVVASISLLIAYFSHEEVFVILPAILLCVLLYQREGPYGIPTVFRKKHWWIAALFGATIIATQLSIVFLTHPPKLGTDQSQRVQIQLTLDNIPYYFGLLFTLKTPKDGPTPWVVSQPLLVVNSLLTVLGCILAFCRRDRRARYCAIFLLVSTATLVFLFTMEADRYYYPLLPVYYLLGAYAFWLILQALWCFARPRLPFLQPSSGLSIQHNRGFFQPARIMMALTVGLLCASVLLVPMLPLNNFNLFLSRVTGSQYHRHYADYDNAAQYIHNHMQKGDVVITVAPAVSILYYVGQVDYFFSIDRALFLFERNGQILETTSGAHALLNEADFQNVMATHTRIWLISDNGGYQGGVTKDTRFTFPPPDFRMVYEGYGSAVYFRSNTSQ